MRVLVGIAGLGLWACALALLSTRQWDAERPQSRIIERYVERVVTVPQPQVYYIPAPAPKPKPRIGPPLKLHPDYK